MKDYYLYKKTRKFKFGEKARIIINDTRVTGTLVGLTESGIPKFKLEDGKIVYGYECWWIPLDLAEQVEKEVLNGQD